MITTFEPHNLTCPKCAQAIRPCDVHGCINRYDHEGQLCPTCEAAELGKEWGE